MENRIAMNSPTDFIIEIGQLSGPGDLLLCMFIILSKIISAMISIAMLVNIAGLLKCN